MPTLPMAERARRRTRAAHWAGLILAAVGAVGLVQVDPHSLERLVASERAFAAATAEAGVRAGFLAFFAEDSVAIEVGADAAQTQLVSARDRLRAEPLQEFPLSNTLIWNPHTGQVSSDGTFGWLTGPFVVRTRADDSVVGQGAYFSVWKRQADGTWRVWLDEGISLPQVWSGATEFARAPVPAGGRGGTAGETPASAEAAAERGWTGWQGRWADGVRVHRLGQMPLVGRAAAADWASRTWTEVTFHLARLEAAASGDLAVAIGGYDARTTAGDVERGTWVRVWSRDAGGRMRIVFETSKAVT